MVVASSVSGNTAVVGAGICTFGKVALSSSTISANTTWDVARYGTGGGICASGDVTVTSSGITGNSASGWDGGISAGGDVTVASSTISGNSAGFGAGGFPVTTSRSHPARSTATRH